MAASPQKAMARPREMNIPEAGVWLIGDLDVPDDATGIVLFAHGSGSGRLSSRNQFVARTIRDAGVGTLLFDLLTHDEEAVDQDTGNLRFDIDFLAQRLIGITDWINRELPSLRVGYFGSSTGGGAALVSAAVFGEVIGGVVSRGGRPDLAGPALARVKSPTLLIVGGFDHPVVEMNEDALAQLRCEKQLKIVPGATHLFEEDGALQQVAELAAAWFRRHLVPDGLENNFPTRRETP